VVLVFRDISERKRLEEQLLQAQKMEAIGTLAGGIAHDFNNILQAILGYTELALGDMPPTSAVQQSLQQVRTAGIRARDLVQRILAFSRRTAAARYPVYLHVLVQETLTLLRASLPSTITIRQHLTQDAGAVLADATQMHQVLMNLCANAEYAMRQTGGVLEVRLEAVEVEATGVGTTLDLSPGLYVRLTVRDTGPGIAPDVRPRIFEPFFTTKGPDEGTGMGLSVVHGIVTSHGGTIAVTGAPGQGATFEVYLPRFIAVLAAPASPAEDLPLRGQGCVLLVEDEAMLARVGQAHLERLNYEVVTCLSSVEALEAFRAAPQRFDLVITDQTMPQMTGDALAQVLRRIRPDIPIILCTGFSHTMDPDSARTLGIDAWLAKPWQARELATTIQRVLDERRRGQT
jgi:nitrogen-specific signal transduction histidine kinase/CheY-like chemotaxis protein